MHNTLTASHVHVHTRSRERKLQHNDKVWEHNRLSSAHTEARTSLARKGQQASLGFHSVPPVIIVQHYNDYSDGLYFANVGAIRKYQRNMKMQARPERRGEERLLILAGKLLWRQVSHGLAQPWVWICSGSPQRSLVRCQFNGRHCFCPNNRWTIHVMATDGQNGFAAMHITGLLSVFETKELTGLTRKPFIFPN